MIVHLFHKYVYTFLQFWHADHITPVAHGGGECDIDNLRTLCTVCHRNVTAEQQRNKAATKRLEAAAFHADIKSFFQSSSKIGKEH